MDPKLNHSDPIYRDLLGFNNASLVPDIFFLYKAIDMLLLLQYRLYLLLATFSSCPNSSLYKMIYVHIPCPSEKLWLLIVANFIDLSFDVLNPDYSADKFQSIVKIVTYKFKNLFMKSYPGCWKFNIRNFKVRHQLVPKFNFMFVHILFCSFVFVNISMHMSRPFYYL
jgi:hypothetical protein